MSQKARHGEIMAITLDFERKQHQTCRGSAASVAGGIAVARANSISGTGVEKLVPVLLIICQCERIRVHV
jgi:hypothetical protein